MKDWLISVPDEDPVAARICSVNVKIISGLNETEM